MQVNSFSKVNNALNMAVSLLKSVKVHDNVPDAEAYKFAKFISGLESALKTPRRNCDVGTVKEQDERFRDFCEKYIGGTCTGCKLQNCGIAECALAWAQMPYEEGGDK